MQKLFLTVAAFLLPGALAVQAQPPAGTGGEGGSAGHLPPQQHNAGDSALTRLWICHAAEAAEF